MLIEAAVAIGSGIVALSPLLIAFGADTLIELASAGALLWRRDVEMRQGAEFLANVEHRQPDRGCAFVRPRSLRRGKCRLWTLGPRGSGVLCEAWESEEGV